MLGVEHVAGWVVVQTSEAQTTCRWSTGVATVAARHCVDSVGRCRRRDPLVESAAVPCPTIRQTQMVARPRK